jgi:ribosomal protein S15
LSQKINYNFPPKVKFDISKKFKVSKMDNWSLSMRIGCITERILNQEDLFKRGKSDRLNLLIFVGERRRLLNILKSCNYEKYISIIKKLGLST